MNVGDRDDRGKNEVRKKERKLNERTYKQGDI